VHIEEFFITDHVVFAVPQTGRLVELFVVFTITGAQPFCGDIENEGLGGDWIQIILMMLSVLQIALGLEFLTINFIE